jgi:RNA polymerase sigma factor (sigma-70 family)
MSAQPADAQLLDLLKTDYRSAFRHLYQEHFRMVEYFIIKNSGNTPDAEDVFQETMLALFNKSRQTDFSLSCALKTYIYSVARNLWLKKLRDTKREFRITDYEKYENIEAEETQEGDDGRQEKVKKAMEQLGEGCRKILVLFYYQKMDMQQIAEQLGYTNADNAKNQKYKCLQQLKSKLV